ncbi:MAG: tricarballylate utilization 4Fe-4S protein TcuB [Alphaproteobacteria bacterium]|nr:tricarballylate utilization 4Fe-4S protein TcuB [Alphaproteobacteria bacterium]MDA8004862.1 tricarballylate utilization 4Fe-4S protein TcuB [Alphaproteobacteria bacterium]MDA8005026.1 tricarballylate utilization 4Fe-4S protein TcuB [Alphaproteobacteria bacterium]MDA8012362.1 tricarballylate utilization 4Fe-4S protein TcuB [Alphaproteobacteria bacterium]
MSDDMRDEMPETAGEARRQMEICNACRYCEGYCAVFPAMFAADGFSPDVVSRLANLCHNCRGCYYSCQYTAPHEFAVNLPAILAEARHESWKEFVWPRRFALSFERAGVVTAATLTAAFIFFFWLAAVIPSGGGEGFYAVISHGVMVMIFVPAFLFPLVAIGVSLVRWRRFVGGGRLRRSDIRRAFRDAATMRNLGGGGDGCNFEDGDGFSQWRRVWHQLTLWGFLLCFASTCAGSAMRYGFGLEAPYAWYTPPKLLGVPGGVLLCFGTAGLAWLKVRADPALGVARIWGGEMAFILLLFGVSATGLALYGATGTVFADWLLCVHLGFVLSFFVMMPYSKMVHGFYRLAALAHPKN